MLISLLILQLIITQILNQTHQQVLSQLSLPHHRIPSGAQEEVRACVQGACGERIKDLKIQPLAKVDERQFFSAQITLCEIEKCAVFVQVFSQRSAILKEEIRFHSVGLP
jgi:hypothetical protein